MFNRQKFHIAYLQKFVQDYEKSLEGFSSEERVLITDNLLAIIKCFRKDKPDYDRAQELNEELHKKFKKRLTNYSNISPSEYFSEESQKHLDLQFDLKLPEAGEQKNFFNKEEQDNFLNKAENLLKNRKRNLYLQMEGADDENTGGLQGKTKGKTKRERDDNVTKLNQEQTALLIYYLQSAKIILRDEYLNNKEAGQAFSILTGYSADSLRQNLNKSELQRISSKKNIDAVANALTTIQLLIDRELKSKK